jgi:long-chain acyl-CoA synthetase
MSAYDDKPWLARYDEGQPHSITPEFPDMLALFRSTVERHGASDALRYFDGRITYRELDELSDALAVGLLDAGFAAGERAALFVQNDPQYVIALLAVWKAGGIGVNVNPMYRERELAHLLADSGARVLVTLETLYRDVAASVVTDQIVITSSELEYQTRNDARILGGVSRVDGALDMAGLIARFRGRTPPPAALSSDDTAVLTYTSGTTGPPKGAMNTHANLVFNAQTYRGFCELGPSDVIFGVAPLFHITGLVAHVAVALLLGAPLVLFHRFEPAAALEIIREERPTFTVGSITVFIALMNAPGATPDALESLTKIWSGGAPIPPSTVKAFQEAFGQTIRNVYGLTETTSPSHCTPAHADAPVDPASGALSVGVPVYDTVVRIVDEDGAELPVGEVGEIVTTGPQVVKGYWPDRPIGERFATGDVGYMDADGWFYIVDRKKDQINVSGYKVWPREVEDVLYEHPAVREAAVVGVPDAYRGETVKAFVSLKPGAAVSEQELIAFTKERMAAYKYPRSVDFLDEIPKTVSGKILRRNLR